MSEHDRARFGEQKPASAGVIMVFAGALSALVVIGLVILAVNILGGPDTYDHPCQEDEFVSVSGTCVHGDTIERQFGDGIDR